jgi:hypothetical protein
VKKGETIVKRFNFNMVGSRYSNFRLKLDAGPGGDYILNGLTFTRVEPHIAHLSPGRAMPGRKLVIQATVTLPPPVFEPEKASLSIARGTTSTVEPPTGMEKVMLYYSNDGGRSYRSMAMENVDSDIYSAAIPGDSILEGDLYYYIEAADSIGQTVHSPRIDGDSRYRVAVTADRTPPLVVHDPVRIGDPGKGISIIARVSDESRVEKVLLYYRPTRQTMEYSVLEMRPSGEGTYTAIIPGEALTTQFDLIYFFEAVDEFGNGTFYPDPDTEDPHIVVKVRR